MPDPFPNDGGDGGNSLIGAPGASADVEDEIYPRDRSQTAGFRYYVEIQGILAAEFDECSGLSWEREVVPYQEGGVNDFVHQLPGPITISKITLKRGITYSQDVWQWFATGMYSGKAERVNMSVVVNNAEGKTVKQWDVVSAWPDRYEGPEPNADRNEAEVRAVEISGVDATSLAGSGRGGGGGTQQEQREPPTDVRALAEAVYALMKQDLRLWRERTGRT